MEEPATESTFPTGADGDNAALSDMGSLTVAAIRYKIHVLLRLAARGMEGGSIHRVQYNFTKWGVFFSFSSSKEMNRTGVYLRDHCPIPAMFLTRLLDEGHAIRLSLFGLVRAPFVLVPALALGQRDGDLGPFCSCVELVAIFRLRIAGVQAGGPRRQRAVGVGVGFAGVDVAVRVTLRRYEAVGGEREDGEGGDFGEEHDVEWVQEAEKGFGRFRVVMNGLSE